MGPASSWTTSATSDRAAYLAVALSSGMGIERLHSIFQACSSAHGALAAPFAFLCTIPGLSRPAATALAGRTLADGERILVESARLGAIALLPDDALFPPSLREIPDAPTVLFAKGRLELLAQPAVAIVGSRDHTPYGADVCRMVAGAAAAAGIAVVSGMARGLDAVAHQAALDAGGMTIGILGNGLGVIYPAANRGLYDRVGTEGLLLSEFPPGERPQAWSFPRRNRLISGLARVTVVVEAAHGSGALITGATALDQGRDVMAVPGPITSATSAGTNALVRDGAEPLLEPADLLAHFPECAPDPGRQPPALRASKSPQPELPTIPIPPELAPVANCLGAELVHIDAISLVSGLPPGDCLASLAQLELIGAVEQRPGGLFRMATRR
ncbi:MAG TPA: DNA-processing protein DprA [Gemmatimonadales bacterium]|nr:DNA-processing protein DprA [Gemmatimonadales bacterium]